ncbi:Fur family ferric uptake transcriptional regulator/Fur family peroxide stress response transcriptional regulator [Natranaerovirga hydrolytica]|uniref:Fur family ferric uptake transcriptional regulator/Fur family peroxide stress response transcriptional regulator n=1 Tax=Natranaerovirga hydrolytica TaxID=680378 RepID=A0A4V2Q0C1_9FIRM|nr:Fur family transcriptional regulator [Natranaerovirga hydrolytica]TCK93241.1 Fur family ferric uptake transcriptional regulator/Fur family peroxide stress response transcriptional regulator [Natranaerovirga hydrolytica]
MIKIDNIELYLRDHGISPSYQRKRIFEYLYTHDNHPTVNQIYEHLVPEIPTLSKTTVYNTLNKFVDKGLVEIITIDGNEIRYDLYSQKTHGHFKCNQCKQVYDVDIIDDAFNSQALDGFDIQNKYFHFTGICKSCKNK